MAGKVIETDFSKGIQLQHVADFEFSSNPGEANRIIVFPQYTYQHWIGFGGAFTESAGYTLSKMSDEKQDEMIHAYFGENGIKYNFCRNHINSCDFSLDNYAYIDDENDVNFETFDISRDKKYIIPMIKKAQSVSKENIKFLASPWSPPPFMKDTKKMNHGGKLLSEYREAWAKYIARYIKEYKKEGIDISMLTIQNEPNATQTWDSCTYDALEESDFGTQYLVPTLKGEGLGNVEVLFWDHNKDNVIRRAESVLKTKEAIDSLAGIAFHWYSGDHFEQLRMFKEKYPDKKLVFTEGCIEKHQCRTSIQNAERYAHDIIGNINNGTEAFIDWNLFLDENGGPNHVGNFCSAPIQGNIETNEIIYNPSYYYIGHFSKYIPSGSKRIGVSKFSDQIETTAFLTPDGDRVVVILNRSDSICNFRLCEEDSFTEQAIAPHSIKTYIYKI